MDLKYSKVIIKDGPEPLLRRVKCLVDKPFQHLCSSTLKKPKLVIFDYDNTLVDSWPQDFKASNAALKALGLQEMEVTEMLMHPHVPAVKAIVEKSGLSYGCVKETYNRIYEQMHETLAPPLPGAESLLQFLKAKDITTAVISNKEHDLLHKTLERNGWAKYFHTAYGASPNKPYKPDPNVIDEIIKDLPKALSRTDIFFVGDALSSDIACALRGGVTPIWLSQYSIDEVEFTNQGPKILKTENCQTLKSIMEDLK
jgi:phosphoglycolate phosphatase